MLSHFFLILILVFVFVSIGSECNISCYHISWFQSLYLFVYNLDTCYMRLSYIYFYYFSLFEDLFKCKLWESVWIINLLVLCHNFIDMVDTKDQNDFNFPNLEGRPKRRRQTKIKHLLKRSTEDKIIVEYNQYEVPIGNRANDRRSYISVLVRDNISILYEERRHVSLEIKEIFWDLLRVIYYFLFNFMVLFNFSFYININTTYYIVLQTKFIIDMRSINHVI